MNRIILLAHYFWSNLKLPTKSTILNQLLPLQLLVYMAVLVTFYVYLRTAPLPCLIANSLYLMFVFHVTIMHRSPLGNATLYTRTHFAYQLSELQTSS